MTRTDEEIGFMKRLATLIRPVLGDRVRLIPDHEGYPIVPGKMGRIEYSGTRTGLDRAGTRSDERLHVFTARRRIVPKLLAVPGLHRQQVGDDEARLWFAPGDTAALEAVAAIIRPRIRRPPSTGNPHALARARAEKAGRLRSQVTSAEADHGSARETAPAGVKVPEQSAQLGQRDAP